MSATRRRRSSQRRTRTVHSAGGGCQRLHHTKGIEPRRVKPQPTQPLACTRTAPVRRCLSVAREKFLPLHLSASFTCLRVYNLCTIPETVACCSACPKTCGNEHPPLSSTVPWNLQPQSQSSSDSTARARVCVTSLPSTISTPDPARLTVRSRGPAHRTCAARV